MKQLRHVRQWVGAGVLVAAAACTAVVTVAPGSAGASMNTSVTTNTAAPAAAFTSCVRANGVSDFPGVTISENGQVHLNGGGVDPLSTTYSDAVESCSSLLPEGSALPTDPQPAAPAAPTLGFDCTGDDCPTPPSAPPSPSRP